MRALAHTNGHVDRSLVDRGANIGSPVALRGPQDNDELVHIVFLCGGEGTRLGELGRKEPKPLLEIGGRPLISYSTEMIDPALVGEVTLASGRNTRRIMGWAAGQETLHSFVTFQTNADYGIPERVLHAAQNGTSQHVVICDSDAIRDGFSLKAALQDHFASGNPFTLAVTDARNAQGNGMLFKLDGEATVTITMRKDVDPDEIARGEWLQGAGLALIRRDAVQHLDLDTKDWWGILTPMFTAKIAGLHVAPMAYFNVNSPEDVGASSAYVARLARH
jgi:NDP-sugar pyrophosphorylase family protein